MRKISLVAASLFISSLGACATSPTLSTYQQASTIAVPPISSAMAEAGVVMPPQGYLELCVRSPGECPSDTRQSSLKEQLTAQRWTELNDVNTSVNSSVRYITDAALYEMSEYWTYPDGRGDCEDYVLLKRKLLLARGWPAETLLIGVALDRENLRHAVLIVATDKGDFVLDNQLSTVVAWADTGYTWEKRQTALSPNVWVALTGDAVAPALFEAPVLMPTVVASVEGLSLTEQAPTASNTATLLQSDVDPIVTSSISRDVPLPLMRPVVEVNPIAAAAGVVLEEAAAVDSIESLKQATDA